MTHYTVTAKHAGKYWELHIDGAGVTQSRSLGTDADEMIRDYLNVTTGADPDSITYDIVPEVGNGLDAEAKAARKAARDAEAARDIAAARNRDAARKLREAGLSGRDTAKVLGITPQRVSQLLQERTADQRTAAGAKKTAAKKTQKKTLARQ